MLFSVARLDEFERRVSSQLQLGNQTQAVEFNESYDRLPGLKSTKRKNKLAKHRRSWHLQSDGVLQVEKRAKW